MAYIPISKEKGFTPLLVIISIISWIYNIIFDNSNKFNNPDNIVIVENLYASKIKVPTQTKASGSEIVKIKGTDVTITYVSKYEITGRVVNVCKYPENDVFNSTMPLDLGISWGNVHIEKNHQKLGYSALGNRFLNTTCSDSVWMQEMGGWEHIITQISNNHIIPSSNEIRNKIKYIKEGQYVRLEGYLVNFSYVTKNGVTTTANTSLSRVDRGAGACEIMYVTDVKWLEEK